MTKEIASELLRHAGRVFNHRGCVSIVTTGGAFLVRSAELDKSGSLLLCEAWDDGAEIAVVTSQIVAIKELADSYPT